MIWPWKKNKKEMVTFHASFADFKWWGGKNETWDAYITIEGREIEISADNVNGVPDRRLLAHIPFVLDNLARLEKLAREKIDTLTDQYQLDGITDAENRDDADFMLSFSYRVDNWGETTFVDFKGDQITAWCTVD